MEKSLIRNGYQFFKQFFIFLDKIKMGNIIKGKDKNIANTQLKNVFQRLDDPNISLSQDQKKEKLLSMYNDYQTLLQESKKLKQAKKNLLGNPPQYIPEYPTNNNQISLSLGKIAQVNNLFTKMKTSWQTTGNVDPRDVKQTISNLRSVITETNQISNDPNQPKQRIQDARKMTQQAQVAIDQLGKFMKSLMSNGSQQTQIQQTQTQQIQQQQKPKQTQQQN